MRRGDKKSDIVYSIGIRALQFAVFLFLLSIIVFVLARLSPGDPLAAYYGEAVEHMSTAQKDAAAARLALDRPIIEQYIAWLGDALRGNFGISYQYKQPVTAVIGKLWLNTLALGGLAYVFTFALSIPLGIFCASREGSFADRALCRIGAASSVVPAFFIALIFILVFAVNLHILPSGGAYSLGGGGATDRAVHLVMPVTVMIISHLWYYSYMIRGKIIEEIHKDYVLLLRVKGLSRARILYRHCLKNALPMLITIMAVSVPHIIAGTYVVEVVFGYPGLGTLTFESARLHDYNMLSVMTLLTGAVVIAANISGQEAGELLDPRMRHDVSVSVTDEEGAV
jgi:peptide/nickel transport system permease protein